jgi:hypothetical protein
MQVLRPAKGLLVATKLNDFPSRKRRSKYPWAEWLDGSTWKLRRGEDFQTTGESMRATAVKAAQAAGKNIRTQVTTDQDGTEVLVLQAYG